MSIQVNLKPRSCLRKLLHPLQRPFPPTSLKKWCFLEDFNNKFVLKCQVGVVSAVYTKYYASIFQLWCKMLLVNLMKIFTAAVSDIILCTLSNSPFELTKVHYPPNSVPKILQNDISHLTANIGKFRHLSHRFCIYENHVFLIFSYH